MADVVNQTVRSRMMASIRSRDTKPELQVRHFLHRRGFRYRLVQKDLPGKPDVVLPKWNAVVFVHGCFWHGHAGCPNATVPATRTDFWVSKIAANSVRDIRAADALQSLGWRVFVVWECSLRKEPEPTLRRLERAIRSEQRQMAI